MFKIQSNMKLMEDFSLITVQSLEDKCLKIIDFFKFMHNTHCKAMDVW